MLDASLTTQLQSVLERLQQPVELVASLDGGTTSNELRALLAQIAALSDKIAIRFDGGDARRPSFSVGRPGEAARIRFAGLPMGHEFTSLVLALLHTGGHPPKADADELARIHALPGGLDFEIFVSLSCHNCPDGVQALNLLAALHPGIRCTMIDGAVFKDEAERRSVLAVPSIYLNGEAFAQGRMTLAEILTRIEPDAAARDAARLSAEAPFDVLIVGGGPAGAAAAIYAARKGVRTGIVAERFGGQVLDTLGIENFISVRDTEGPRLAASLEQHVRQYDVDIMNGQRAAALLPGADGLTEIHLSSGATLKSRSIILSTGARWRNMNVPGEERYKARGVAYCPHCDGPLFKGKRVAVVGGGNSGVEAAIDLAGLATQVTLLEFDAALRADAVLQAKLRSLPNVTVLTQAQTTEVLGDGERVNGLRYRDRASGREYGIELEGIFVQIGLLPNTDWLKGTLALSPRGEIDIDSRGQTSLPGVFAAGDCTTVPYKQIVIAMGEGAKAALSAFDHLIRTPREAHGTYHRAALALTP